MTDITVEKRIGWDWEVTYEDEDEGGEETMVVFGAMSIDEAIADARSSFHPDLNPDGPPTILGAKRA